MENIKPIWLFFAIWIPAIILLNPSEQTSLIYINISVYISYFLLWLIYPLFIVFDTKIIKASTKIRIATITALSIFSVTFFIEYLYPEISNEIQSNIGMLSLLMILYFSSKAFSNTEGTYGININTGWGGIMFQLFFFPLFGVFLIHARYIMLSKKEKHNA